MRRSNVSSRVVSGEAGTQVKIRNLFLENFVRSEEKRHLTRVVSFNPQKGKITKEEYEKAGAMMTREVTIRKTIGEEDLHSLRDDITVQGMRLLRDLNPGDTLSPRQAKATLKPPSAGTQTHRIIKKVSAKRKKTMNSVVP